jgi:hypothetical protein
MKLTKTIRQEILFAAANYLFAAKISEALDTVSLAVADEKVLLGDKLAAEIPRGWEKYISIHSSVSVHMHLKEFLWGDDDPYAHRQFYKSTSWEIKLPVQFAGSYNERNFGDHHIPWAHPTPHTPQSTPYAVFFLLAGTS